MTIPICYKNEERAIDSENIWKDDLFGRNKLSINYTKIIKSIIQPFVLSINAKYGSGKTYFLNRWAEELKKDKEYVIFFNAWDCDYVDKPLLPFLYNFLEQLKEQQLVCYDFQEDLKNCQNIVISSFKKFIDTSSLGIVNLNELREKTDANSLKILKIKTLEEYKQLQNTLVEFKKALGNIIEKLDGKNLYIFIDELERCRPIFAVELLEAIKHLFNVKGLVFILGIDRNQLKHTISNIYGNGMDGEGYLRRFIDLELGLPQPNIKDFIFFLKKQFEIENTEKFMGRNWVQGYEEFHRFFEIFSSLYDFQLRDIEQIYSKFNTITKMIDENILKITPVLALLIILKQKDTKLYNDFTLNKLTYYNAREYLTTKIFNKIKSESNEKDLEYFVKICMSLQPINYEDLIDDKTDINEKRLLNELWMMQRYTAPYDTDRIQYMKNMISCISIE